MMPDFACRRARHETGHGPQAIGQVVEPIRVEMVPAASLGDAPQQGRVPPRGLQLRTRGAVAANASTRVSVRPAPNASTSMSNAAPSAGSRRSRTSARSASIRGRPSASGTAMLREWSTRTATPPVLHGQDVGGEPAVPRRHRARPVRRTSSASMVHSRNSPVRTKWPEAVGSISVWLNDLRYGSVAQAERGAGQGPTQVVVRQVERAIGVVTRHDWRLIERCQRRCGSPCRPPPLRPPCPQAARSLRQAPHERLVPVENDDMLLAGHAVHETTARAKHVNNEYTSGCSCQVHRLHYQPGPLGSSEPSQEPPANQHCPCTENCSDS